MDGASRLIQRKIPDFGAFGILPVRSPLKQKSTAFHGAPKIQLVAGLASNQRPLRWYDTGSSFFISFFGIYT